jgi:hypothetical protein
MAWEEYNPKALRLRMLSRNLNAGDGLAPGYVATVSYAMVGEDVSSKYVYLRKWALLGF